MPPPFLGGTVFVVLGKEYKVQLDNLNSADGNELFTAVGNVLQSVKFGEHTTALAQLRRAFELLEPSLCEKSLQDYPHELQTELESMVFFSPSSTAAMKGMILLPVFKPSSCHKSKDAFLNDFGCLAIDVHQPKLAEQVFERVLKMKRERDCLDTAVVHSNIGCSLSFQGQYQKAKIHLLESSSLFQRLINKREEKEAQQFLNSCLASVYNNLGWLLTKLGEGKKALEHFEQISAITANGQTLEKHIALPVRRNMAELYLRQNNPENAEKILKECKSLCEDTGEVALLVLVELELLSVLQGRQVEDTVDSYIQKFEVQEPYDELIIDGVTIQVLEKLACLSAQTGKLIKAEAMANKVVHLCKTVYGTQHPVTASALQHLACILWEHMDISSCISTLEESSEILEEIYQSNHPQLAACYFKLSFLQFTKKNDREGARKYFGKAVNVIDKVFGPEMCLTYADKLLHMKDIVGTLVFEFGSGKSCGRTSVRNGKVRQNAARSSADLWCNEGDAQEANKNCCCVTKHLVGLMPCSVSVRTVLNALQFGRVTDDVKSFLLDQSRPQLSPAVLLIRVIHCFGEMRSQASSGQSSNVDGLSELMMMLERRAVPALFSNEVALNPEDETGVAEKRAFIMAALSFLGCAFTKLSDQHKAFQAYSLLCDCIVVLQEDLGQSDAFDNLFQEHRCYYSAEDVSTAGQELTVCTIITTEPEDNNPDRVAHHPGLAKVTCHGDRTSRRLIVTGRIQGQVDIEDLRRISKKCVESVRQSLDVSPESVLRSSCLIQLEKPVCSTTVTLLLSELDLLPLCLTVALESREQQEECLFRYCHSILNLASSAHTSVQLMNKLLITFIREEGKLAAFSDVSHDNGLIVLTCHQPTPLRITIVNREETVEVISQVVSVTTASRTPECHCTSITDFIQHVIRECSSQGTVKMLRARESCVASGSSEEQQLPEVVPHPCVGVVTGVRADDKLTPVKVCPVFKCFYSDRL